jgi:DNA-binding PadR family transcriptional regulator
MGMRPDQTRELTEDTRFDGVGVVMVMGVGVVKRVAVIVVAPVALIGAVRVAMIDVARIGVWVGHNAQDASPAGCHWHWRLSERLAASCLVIKFEYSCFPGGMNPTRLFILGALSKHGPMYGHQLRRDARIDRTEMWSEVQPGSLYGALHRLAAEGLIEALRTEQDGQLPARTVYGITAEGRRELRALRAEALQEIKLHPDPVDLALAMSGDVGEDTLRGYVEDRVRALSARASQLEHQRDRAWPDQTVADDLVIEHARMRVQVELDWHQLVLDRLGKLTADGGQQVRS